jgi:hypothetical protein
MRALLDEYRRSLKLPEAEELFDLGFYRPSAYAFVKAVYRSPITPNQVTMLSLAAGLASAWCFAAGAGAALAWGAFWYAVANILDCADGQLARLQQSGTPLGRLVDGIADYISSIAIFLGIGAGLSAAGTPMWPAVVAGGLSSALHAMFFDHYQSEFLSSARAERGFNDHESRRIAAELERPGSAARALVLRLYLRYLRVQDRAGAGSSDGPVDPAAYRAANRRMIRLWSVLGPTTNRTLLMVCALAGRLDAYLWIVMAAGNGWLAFCYLMQRMIHQAMAGGRR